MEERKSKRRSKIITAGIIVGVIIFALAVLYIQSLNCPNPKEAVVKCISSKATLYIQDGCPHCLTQQERFGDCSKLLNVVDCTKTPNKCVEAGIRAVPTWILNGTLIEGAYKIDELKEMTGC